MNEQMKPARLGRGLSALLGDYSGAQDAMKDPGVSADNDSADALGPTSDLAIERVSPNPRQPRRTFVEADLEDLANSIRQKGVIQPILVRTDPEAADRYQIIAGERRWRAARRAGLKMIPAVIREMDDREVLEIAIIENVQRADLNAIEEAEAYKSLMDRFGRTQDSVAAQVGKSREHVANTLRLLQLPDDVREHVKDGRLSPGHARALLKTSNPGELATTVIEKKLTVRDTEALAKAQKDGGKAKSQDEKDVDTKALELDLQRALGLDVEIKHKNGKGGEVRIKYVELEQLDEVCRILSRPKIKKRDMAEPSAETGSPVINTGGSSSLN